MDRSGEQVGNYRLLRLANQGKQDDIYEVVDVRHPDQPPTQMRVAAIGTRLTVVYDSTKQGSLVTSVAWSPTENLIAHTVAYQLLRIWTPYQMYREDGRQADFSRLLYRQPTRKMSAVSWAPDSPRLVTNFDEVVRIWNLTEGGSSTAIGNFLSSHGLVGADPRSRPGFVTDLKGHLFSVSTVAWSHDGTRIASGGWDNTVNIWSVVTGNIIASYKGHSTSVMSLAWSPSDNAIVSCDEHEYHVWDAASGATRLVYSGHKRGGFFSVGGSVAWAPNGDRIASAKRGERDIHLWEASSGALILKCVGHTKSVNAIAWSPDSSRLASGGSDSTLRIWNASNGSEILCYKNRGMAGILGYTVTAVDWSPNGMMTVSGDINGCIRVVQAV